MDIRQQPLGEIACTIPGATRIFKNYRLDFCCGGQHSLADAASRKGIELETLVAALEGLQAETGEKDWRDAPADELIEHILERYHDRLREQFHESIRLAERVEKVHAAHELCPHGLANHLIGMWDELLGHMMKEEQVLFPMLRQGMKHIAFGPISVMQAEHVQHGEALEKMLALTNQLTIHEAACNTWRALYLGLSELHNDLMDHIHLENNILFAPDDSEFSHTCC